MHSLLLAVTLAAGMQIPAATTTATCAFTDTAPNAGYSSCDGGTGFQHRAYGICYGPDGSEYAVFGPWANPDKKSSIRCDRFYYLLGDFELRSAP